jgi:hypothetical protein
VFNKTILSIHVRSPKHNGLVDHATRSIATDRDFGFASTVISMSRSSNIRDRISRSIERPGRDPRLIDSEDRRGLSLCHPPLLDLRDDLCGQSGFR